MVQGEQQRASAPSTLSSRVECPGKAAPLAPYPAGCLQPAQMGQRLARGEPEHRAFDLPAEQGGQAVVDRPGLPADSVQPLTLREMVLLKLAHPFGHTVKRQVTR